MEIAMRLSGFLFLFILALNFTMVFFGRKIEVVGYNAAAKLQMINADPNKFKITLQLHKYNTLEKG